MALNCSQTQRVCYWLCFQYLVIPQTLADQSGQHVPAAFVYLLDFPLYACVVASTFQLQCEKSVVRGNPPRDAIIPRVIVTIIIVIIVHLESIVP